MMNQSTKLIWAIACVAFVFPLSDAQAIMPLQTIEWNKLKPLLPPAKTKNTEEFCSKFTDTAETIKGKIAEKQVKITGFISEHKGTLAESRDSRDATLEGKRDKADQNRDEWYARLAAKADTDSEKNAVLEFRQTLDAAIDTRRTAVDKAIEDFRTGVDDASASRKNSLESTRDAFKTAVEKAVAQVSTDCEKGETTAVIRSNFRNSLKDARATLSVDKKDTDKVRTQVKALAEVRKKAISNAIASFETTRKGALEKLKTAFGE